MCLSDVELGGFGEGSIQEPARNSIIVRNETWVHKKPFWHIEEARLEIVCTINHYANHNGNHYGIKLESMEINGLLFF